MNPVDVLATVTAAALLGLSSMPHCAAMCGPLSAAVCTRSGGPRAPLRYQIGRALGYTLAGVIAARFGLAVSDVLPADYAHLLFPALTALACIVVAFQLWPRRSSRVAGLVTLRTAKSTETRAVAASTNSSGAQQWSGSSFVGGLLDMLPRDASVVGFVTTLLPCGALAGALLLAAGRGDAFSGGLFMLVFALISGTATVLPAILSRWLRAHRRAPMEGLRRTVAAMFVVLAVIAIARPLRAAWTGSQVAGHSHSAAPNHPSCH